jgi:YopX protein.
MREIKFRAWDSDAKTMVYTDKEYPHADYWWEFNPVKVGFISGETGGNQFDPPEPIVDYIEEIMQFAGSTDDNGNDIYEGDIMLIEDYGKYIVEFPYIPLYGGSYQKNTGEIIGNIYENPELIK